MFIKDPHLHSAAVLKKIASFAAPFVVASSFLFLQALDVTVFSFAEDCHKELGGAAGGALPDAAFSASSSYDEASVGPQNAR